MKINMAQNIFSILAIFYFFATIGSKMGTATGDARRRLKILYYGAAVGLTPFFITFMISLIWTIDLGQDIPRWFSLPSFFILLLFPLSLAYVVIVHRAVDIRILIRQGTKYFFASSTVRILTFLIAGGMTLSIIRLIRNPDHQRMVDIVRIFGLMILFFVFRFILSKRLQQKNRPTLLPRSLLH
jgi:phosphoserine phosphatase RsbU/P